MKKRIVFEIELKFSVSEPFPSNEGRYIKTIMENKVMTTSTVSEPFPSNEGRYKTHNQYQLGVHLMLSFRTFSF